MARIITVAALAVAGLSVGGCVVGTDYGLTPQHNPTITSVNEPVVQRTDYVFDVAVGGGMTSAELARLNAWFQSLELGYGDRVAIDAGGGYVDERAMSEIGRVAGAYGLLLDAGAPVTAGQVPPGGLRVVVSRTAASVPGCPMWNPSEIGARATTSPNYGCATNSNLAAMIANPTDLVVGQTGTTSVDTATSSKAIQLYRKSAPSGGGGTTVKAESSKGGGS